MEEEVVEKKKKGKASRIINIVLIVIIAILLIVIIINQCILTRMNVEGESMYPTLHDGDKIMVLHTKNVKVDDIIVFKREGKYIVKRVVAVEGDKVKTTSSGDIYINDEHIGSVAHGGYVDEIVLGEGELFVLGDNRLNSRDSAEYGPINRKIVVGKLI